ncbi:MAG: hypothetical protein QXP83_04805 [Candidatus Nezhaarchaeales archaeon]
MKNIPIMQRKSREAALNEEKALTKRTTIIFDEEEREFIDKLIQEGKEPGIKSLISKMLDVYRSMMIYDWRFPGEYYCGISRIVFFNVELIDILIHNIPKEKWQEIGRKMGEAIKVSIEATLGIQTTDQEKWQDVFKRLRVQGFGDFYLKDKYIVVKAPFINEPEIWVGFLEGLLGIELNSRTSTAPFVLEIKSKGS